VWERADSYNPALGVPVAWLVRISRNRAIDRLRARMARANVQEPDAGVKDVAVDSAPAANPEGMAALSEEQKAIERALALLPPEQRTLIEAAFYQGFTQSELAHRFQIPLGTVKTRIRTGMQALRQSLRFLVEESS
jgi:RNA polymerase sigma-70 factor, ECF subfamily